MKKIYNLLFLTLFSASLFAQSGTRSTSVWSNDMTDASAWTVTGTGWAFASTLPTGSMKTNFTTFNAGTKGARGQYAVVSNVSTAVSISSTIQYNQSIDLTGKPYVTLSFDEIYYKMMDSTFVEISNNNTDWTQFSPNASQASGKSANPSRISIDISSVAGNKPTVYIRFTYKTFELSTFIMGYGWAIDDIAIDANNPNDAGITAMLQPSTKCGMGSETVQVTIKNYGGVAITSCPVSYKVGTNVVTETFTGNIASQGTANYTFSAKANLASFTTGTIKSWTGYTNDGDNTNDTLVAPFSNLSPITLTTTSPYNFGFESNTNEWIFYANQYNGWFLYASAKHTGTQGVAYEPSSSYNYHYWLTSRCINLEAGKQYQISYWNKNSGASKASQIILAYGTSNDSASMTNIIGTKNCTTNVWIKDSTTFTAPSTNTFYMGIKYNTATGDQGYYYIDDIQISELISTGINSTNTKSFQIFPNPANDILNINNIGKDAKIMMINSLGQIVYNTIASDNIKINTENLTEGVYFVRVNAQVSKVIISK